MREWNKVMLMGEWNKVMLMGASSIIFWPGALQFRFGGFRELLCVFVQYR